eukprot:5440042-Prorocentrum_lima.AAC.1
MQQFSEFHNQARIRLLAKLFVDRHQDPAASATFQFDSLKPYYRGTWRPGRPRLHWYPVTLSDYWVRLSDGARRWPAAVNLELDSHMQALLEHAVKILAPWAPCTLL